MTLKGKGKAAGRLSFYIYIHRQFWSNTAEHRRHRRCGAPRAGDDLACGAGSQQVPVASAPNPWHISISDNLKSKKHSCMKQKLLSRNTSFFICSNIFRCFLATARALTHGMLLNPCFSEKTRTIGNLNTTQFSCMINLILRKLSFFSFKSIYRCFWAPAWRVKHKLLLNSCVSENTGTPENSQLQKTHLHGKSRFEKNWLLQFFKYLPLFLGHHSCVKNTDSCHNNTIRRTLGHLKITISENLVAW